MSNPFKKATKLQAKLRLAIFGPSGAGKTFTALRMATGMGGKIAVIDTEHGSASKYADRFNFDTVYLEDKSIDGYVAMIRAACNADYTTLIIDSLSHGWQELLEQIDKLAKTKYKGNTWSAWSDGTPKQRQLVDAILSCDCHIIATMRSKTEWTTETNNGKNRPIRIGLAPEQGKGIEYEFDMLLELSPEHIGTVIKDRTGKYQDQMIEKPGEDFGKSLIKWLSEGAAPAPKAREPKRKAEDTAALDTMDKQAGASAMLDAFMPDGPKKVDDIKLVIYQALLFFNSQDDARARESLAAYSERCGNKVTKWESLREWTDGDRKQLCEMIWKDYVETREEVTT